jgi:hypothetical protein
MANPALAKYGHEKVATLMIPLLARNAPPVPAILTLQATTISATAPLPVLFSLSRHFSDYRLHSRVLINTSKNR